MLRNTHVAQYSRMRHSLGAIDMLCYSPGLWVWRSAWSHDAGSLISDGRNVAIRQLLHRTFWWLQSLETLGASSFMPMPHNHLQFKLPSGQRHSPAPHFPEELLTSSQCTRALKVDQRGCVGATPQVLFLNRWEEDYVRYCWELRDSDKCLSLYFRRMNLEG